VMGFVISHHPPASFFKPGTCGCPNMFPLRFSSAVVCPSSCDILYFLAMRISRAISIYLRHAIKAYDSLLVDGSLPDSNLELLNHTLANIAPPTTQSRSQQGHEAQDLFSDPIETCENATDTRQKWSKIQKEEIHRRKDLQQQFRQKRAQKQRKSLQNLFLPHNKRKPTKSSMAVVPPIKSQL
jgi:hypothetical protein